MGVLVSIAGALGINVLRLAIYASLAAGAVSGAVALKFHYINIGRADALQKIAAEDQETINEASSARDRVRACRDTGGVWDVSEGQCNR